MFTAKEVLDRLLTVNEIDFSFVRSSGSGGQNVNKVSSKAQLRFYPYESTVLSGDLRSRFLAMVQPRLTLDGSLLIFCDEHRDQPRNRQECLDRLEALIAKALVPPKKRVKTKATRGSKERRLDGKKRNSAKKKDRRVRQD
jgi:ribosome-associated protein